MARRPGVAGFALAPAAGMRPPRGVSPNRKGEQEVHQKEPIMAELRNVAPLTLKPNPHNPRVTPPPAAMDEQLLASIKAIGIIQPPIVV